MKILFYRLWDESTIHLPHCHCDYLLDCLFHGFRSLYGEACIDANKMVHMYRDFTPKDLLYGKGFTLYAKLDDIEVDRTEIEEKIKGGFFDLIVLGVHTSVYNYHRNEIAGLCEKVIKETTTPIIVVDGNDENNITPYLPLTCPVFKRELTVALPNFFPIGFAVPKEIVVNEVPPKSKEISSIVPQFGGFPTWTFSSEEEYYEEYRQSKFAWTWKKGGWHTMRHLEIVACGCVPLFKDVIQCPYLTMVNFPKEKCLEVLNKDLTKIKESEYLDFANYFLEYTKRYLTTERLAKDVIKKIDL